MSLMLIRLRKFSKKNCWDREYKENLKRKFLKKLKVGVWALALPDPSLDQTEKIAVSIIVRIV